MTFSFLSLHNNSISNYGILFTDHPNPDWGFARHDVIGGEAAEGDQHLRQGLPGMRRLQAVGARLCEGQNQFEPLTVWPDLAIFHHLGNILKVFGHFFSNYLVFGKIVNLVWQIFYAFAKVSLF